MSERGIKAVILAGGLGTRISEETIARPKPMVEVGAKPLLWHILKIYASHGVKDFIICLGYRGYVIKEYFANYFLHTSNVTFDMKENRMTVHQNLSEDWRVTLVDTGEKTMTGGRLKRIQEHVDSTFFMTYGDGVGDVDITATLAFHRRRKALATVTAVQAPTRFGVLDIRSDRRVRGFREKVPGDAGWISGGFFVLDPKVFKLISDDTTRWEAEPLQALARKGQLAAYQHDGFWYAMDTLRDKLHLEELWTSGRAPWKTWN